MSTLSQIKMLTEEQIAKLDEYKGSATSVYDLYRFLTGQPLPFEQEEMAQVKWDNSELEDEIKLLREQFPYNYDQAVTIFGNDGQTFWHVQKVIDEINRDVMAKYDMKLNFISDNDGRGLDLKKIIRHVLKTEFPNADPTIDLEKAKDVFETFIYMQKPELFKYLEDVIKKCEMEKEKVEEEYALVIKKLKEESQNCNKRVRETLKEDSKKRLKI